MVQFNSGSITVQGQLHYWLVSQILIGLVTLMIGSLLQVMYLLLVQDLLLGLARNKVPLLSLPQKQSTVQQFKQVRKPCGFDKSCQSLVLSSDIRPHFGVIIRVPSSYAKIQCNINVANTLNYICTSLESSSLIMFLKCSIARQKIKSPTFSRRPLQKRSSQNFDPWLVFRKLSLRGDRPLISSFLLLLCQLCKSFNPIPSCS